MAPVAARSRPVDEAQAQPTPEEVVLHSNLCLLGVQEADGAKSVTLGQTMFRKPNAKALELILYHSYSTIRGKLATKKHFKGIWPIQEKKQQKDFYLKIHEWFKEMKDAGRLDAISATTTSSMRAAVGPRLVSFLCDLTHVALLAEHARLCPGNSVQPARAIGTLLDGDARTMLEISQPLLDVARAQAQLHAQRFTEEAAAYAYVEARMEEGATRLKEAYYGLKAQKARLEQQLATKGLDPIAIISAEQPDAHLDSAGNSDQTSGRQPRNPLEPALPSAQPPSPPRELLSAQGRAMSLWQEVDRHLERFSDLPGLVDGIVDSEVHPYAIDGAKLRALAGLAPTAPSGPAGAGVSVVTGSGSYAAAADAEFDIVAMLEEWADSMEGIEAQVAELDGGDGAAPRAAAAVTPLVATSDARSHAPHLFAQLGVHRSCLQGMRELEAGLEDELNATAARIQKLRPQVAAAIAAVEGGAQRSALLGDEQGLAAVMASAAAAMSSSNSGIPGLAAPPKRRPRSSSGTGSSGIGAAGAAPNTALLRPEGLQLVPPTPVLQQIIGRTRKDALGQQQQQQHQQQQHKEQLEQPRTETEVPSIHAQVLSIPNSTAVTQNLHAESLPASSAAAAIGADQAATFEVPIAPAVGVDASRSDVEDGALDSEGSEVVLSPALSFDSSVAPGSLASSQGAPDIGGSGEQQQDASVGPSGTAAMHENNSQRLPSMQPESVVLPGHPALATSTGASEAGAVVAAGPAAVAAGSITGSDALDSSVSELASAGPSVTPSISSLALEAELGAAELEAPGGDLLTSPLLSDATDWLSSAKPRRLSYNAAATYSSGGKGRASSHCGGGTSAAAAAAAKGDAGGDVQQTPAVTLPGVGVRAGGGAEQQSLTLVALRERFSRATSAGAGVAK